MTALKRSSEFGIARTDSTNDLEEIERKYHDSYYAGRLPFNFSTNKIDPEHVIWWEDYCCKAGRRKDRGHRTKRVFELMNLEGLQGKKILDVGCGNGQYSVFFALLGAEVYGFDISPVGIQMAREIANENGVNERCQFSVQNASNMHYYNNLFDIVLFHEVLHHAIKYPNVKEETMRVVKKGGLVICAESVEGNIFFKFGRLFTMRVTKEKGDVELTLSDLRTFADGFSEYRLEMMSLFFMIKRVGIKFLDFSLIRWLMFLAKKIDDVILQVFPFLQRYCGECILVLKK